MAPQAVVPPTGHSYAQSAASSPLDGADWVYVAKGGAQRPMADKYSGPYQVLEKGNKAWKLQVGERVEVVSRDCLKPHLGSVLANTWEAEEGLSGSGGFLFFVREARGACVANTRIDTGTVINPPYCIYSNPRVVILENEPNVLAEIYDSLSATLTLVY